MKIAFLADPLDSFSVWKDSTFAMMAEAERRGYEIHAFELQDISLSGGDVLALSRRIFLTGDEDGQWYRAEEARLAALNAFDAVIVRKDPPFDMPYLYATYLLELAERQGVRILNRPGALRDFNEKLAIARFPQYIAPTLVASCGRLLREFQARHGDVILKPLDGMGGAGIFRIRDDAMNLGAAIETLSGNGRRPVMIQKYIPEIEKGDKRVLLIGGRVVPYALARIPGPGDIRGNLAAGATGVAQPLSDRDRQIAEDLAPGLSEKGLFLVGLDIIGDWLTEINVTSPTCFREITAQTGVDVARMFFDALLETA